MFRVLSVHHVESLAEEFLVAMRYLFALLPSFDKFAFSLNAVTLRLRRLTCGLLSGCSVPLGRTQLKLRLSGSACW